MSKELEEIKNIIAIHFGALGFLNPSENEQILKDRDKVLNALTEYEAIKNANPSEALKCLDSMYARLPQWDLCRNLDQCNTIKQALLKAQEPKHYLKWEDLEFTNEEKTMKVKLNNNIYTMFYYSDEVCFDTVSIAGVFIDCCSKQFFNDLHLERVEE